MPVTLRTRPAETTREIELSVAGMTCAACAIRVQKKLSKLDGVTASVNYATGTARVIAPAGVPVETLTEAVGAARHATYLWHRLIVASAAMALSSVFVVWNSLRLRRFTAGSY